MPGLRRRLLCCTVCAAGQCAQGSGRQASEMQADRSTGHRQGQGEAVMQEECWENRCSLRPALQRQPSSRAARAAAATRRCCTASSLQPGSCPRLLRGTFCTSMPHCSTSAACTITRGCCSAAVTKARAAAPSPPGTAREIVFAVSLLLLLLLALPRQCTRSLPAARRAASLGGPSSRFLPGITADTLAALHRHLFDHANVSGEGCRNETKLREQSETRSSPSRGRPGVLPAARPCLHHVGSQTQTSIQNSGCTSHCEPCT